jgi:hypothetical protein
MPSAVRPARPTLGAAHLHTWVRPQVHRQLRRQRRTSEGEVRTGRWVRGIAVGRECFLLTLAGLILFGGSVGNTFGQRRTFILGLSGIRRPRPAKSAGPRRQPRFLEYDLGRAVLRVDELRTDRGDGRVIARGGVRSACASAWRSVGVAREASAPSVVPPRPFRDRRFVAANAMTVVWCCTRR